jgi:predicted RND superfamily exporter protein
VSDFLLTRRGPFLVVLLLMTVALGASASRLEFSTSPETVIETDDESLDLIRSHEVHYGSFERRVVLLLKAENVFDRAFVDRIGQATVALEALEITARVRSLARTGFPVPEDPDGLRKAVLGNRLLCPFLVSRDGSLTALYVDLTPGGDTADRRAESIDRLVETVKGVGFDPLVAGVPPVRQAYADYIRESLLFLPPFLSAILVLLLYFAVGRILPVLGLLVSIGLATVWTVGIIGASGARVNALTSILPALLMVVGVAAGVHVVAQYQEERERGASSRESSRRAISKMALPCGLAAITTAVGFSSLVVTDLRDVREFGLFSAIGAILMFVIGVPMTGILLSFLPDARASSPVRGFDFSRTLDRLARLIDRRPWTGLAAGGALFAAAVVGLLHLERDTFMLEDIAEDAPIHIATKTVDDRLGGAIGFDLVIDSESDLLDGPALQWLEGLEEEIRGIDGVRGVLGPGTLVAEASRAAGHRAAPALLLAIAKARGGADVVGAFLREDRRGARIAVRTGDRGSRVVRVIREHVLRAAAADTPPGVTFRVGGLAVLADTVLSRLVGEMAKSTALAFVTIFLLVTLIFRSLKTGILSMIPNFLPLVVAAGFMGFAGITIRSSMALIFAVALGIAVDDTIHMLIRFRRETRAGKTDREATAAAVRYTGRPVVLSSIILIAGFLTYLLAGFVATRQFGIIAAVTIAAAVVGDLLLLPALLVLAGRNSGRVSG